MKLVIFILFVFVSVLKAQTNVYIINNSQVVINNYTTPTNSISIPQTNLVVVPQYHVERLKWESMLEQRRVVTMRSYLKKYK